ncbi:hypothetical protein E2C01_072488 [Portunus trituberculatus]|uniref:Uncharacterized protein n=1 Tax=Portunus trituberculatus TaxID=210409 RepID=A0A5B7I929_PORTR|nr:hypothetical protein [Portunus trituberculatus]
MDGRDGEATKYHGQVGLSRPPTFELEISASTLESRRKKEEEEEEEEEERKEKEQVEKDEEGVSS